MTIEAMKLALEALETLMIERGSVYEKAIAALKARLAQQEQEPVAWLSIDSIGERYLCFDKPLDNDPVKPLYTTPPQRTEPLTGHWYKAKEIDEMVRDLDLAMNGEEGAAKQAKLCDLMPQLIRHLTDEPPAQPAQQEPLTFAGLSITEIRLPTGMTSRFEGGVLIVETARSIKEKNA